MTTATSSLPEASASSIAFVVGYEPASRNVRFSVIAETRSRLSAVRLSSRIPSRRFRTSESSAKPKRRIWRVGGTSNDIMSRGRAGSAEALSARGRRSGPPPRTSCLHLHAPHRPPRETVIPETQSSHRQHRPPDPGPARSLEKRIAHHDDEVAGLHQARDPSERHRNVLDREDEAGQEESEEEAAERDDLDGRGLIGNRRADERAEAHHAEQEQHAAHEERGGIAREPEAEQREHEPEHEAPLSEPEDHAGDDLPEEELVRRDAGDVDLHDGLLLALA